MISCKTIDASVICLRRKPVSKKNLEIWKSVFPKLKVFDAVDGEMIDARNDKRIHILARMFLTGKNKVANDSIFSVPSIGAIGCYLSHYHLWRQCLRLQKPTIIIEQDAVFSDKARTVLPEAIRNIPPDADYVSLLYIKQPHVIKYNKFFNRIVGPECDGNQCYYLSPSGAKKILRVALPIVTQCDLLVGVVSHVNPSFKAYCIRTRLYSIWRVLSDNMMSSIQKFAVKKYLPRSNIFYYAIVFLLLGLILYVLHTL